MPELSTRGDRNVHYLYARDGSTSQMNEGWTIPPGYERVDGYPRYWSLMQLGYGHSQILEAERNGTSLDRQIPVPDPIPTPPPAPRGGIGSSTMTTAGSTNYIDPVAWGTRTSDWVSFSEPTDTARIYEQMRAYTPSPARRASIPVAPTLRRSEPSRDMESLATGTVLDFFEPLYKIQGRKPQYSEGKKESYIGLELENEAAVAFDTPSVSGWRFHDEGSLRNFGFEYVQSEPAPVKESKRRVGVLLRALKREMEGQSCLNSIRTSVHVHFDVLHYTYLDILNFSLVYWLLEGFISHFCGDSRKGNLFCLRLKDASVAQQMVTEAINNRMPYQSELMNDNYRYASLNLASIQKFGSLEFRIMRGTDSLEDISTWVDTLECIKQFALKFRTPAELREFFLSPKNPAEELPRVVFGEGLYYKLLSHVKDKSRIATDIRDAFMTVSPILQAHEDFKFTDEIEKAKTKIEEDKKRHEAEMKAHEETMFRIIAEQEEAIGEDEIIADQAENFDYTTIQFTTNEGDF